MTRRSRLLAPGGTEQQVSPAFAVSAERAPPQYASTLSIRPNLSRIARRPPTFPLGDALTCLAAADGRIARMMRKPNSARLTSDAALLLACPGFPLSSLRLGGCSRWGREFPGWLPGECRQRCSVTRWAALWAERGALDRRRAGARWIVCADARLTSALGPGWLRVGDMMFDWVFRQMVMRPLSLFGSFPVGSAAVSPGAGGGFIG